MIQNISVLAIIPARSGSKGLPDKNIKILNDRPLLGWPILAAKNSKYVDRIVVSTDSEDYAEIARMEGAEVPFLRSDDLASDKASSIDVVLHAVDFCEQQDHIHYGYVVLLEPTSPLTESEDIDRGLEKLVNQRFVGDSIVGVAKVENTHPAFDVRIDGEGRIRPYSAQDFSAVGRRQDIEELFFFEGSFYISDVTVLRKKHAFYHDRTIAQIMPRWKSFEIDSMIDFICIEAIIKNREILKKGDL